VVDFCCVSFVSLVSHYLNDNPCKNYNYTFVFVKVIPKTLLVPFFRTRCIFVPTADISRRIEYETFEMRTVIVTMTTQRYNLASHNKLAAATKPKYRKWCYIFAHYS